MPLLQISLIKSNVAGVITKYPVELIGGISKQPIVLKYYQIVLESTEGDQFERGTFYAQLPFLNSFDINSNSVILNSICLPLGYSDPVHYGTKYAVERSSQMDILFNPSKNINSVFSDWEVYDASGQIINPSLPDPATGKSNSFRVTLMFEYRRPELI
jgi:hypothetical protein